MGRAREVREDDIVWKGNPRLEPFLVLVGDLTENPENTRRHGTRDVAAIAQSMHDHGQQQFVVFDAGGIVRAGNGRLLAARQLGWTHIAAVPTDISDEKQLRLYAIADNRTSELSAWDLEALSKQLQALSQEFNLVDTKLWEDYELGPLLEARWTPPESKHDDGSGESVDGGPDMGEPIRLTAEQRTTVDRAIRKVRDNEDDQEISEGRAIELLCGDWLGGN